ncbi:MAG: hypothetical protein LUF30_08765 [Lachnospiraceae bacterium]|nr:hypothetical protein [Lachnospiraceae bacterium]
MNKKNLTLNVNIPFCKEKCGYCDQFVLTGYTTVQKEEYIHALYRELASVSEDLADYEVTVIHITGGSPCRMGGSILKELIQNIRTCMDVAADAEITLDCVPDSVGTILLEELRGCGEVRLAIEQETFDVQQHFSLEQNFTVTSIQDCMTVLDSMHWTDFGISLLYGLPGQGIASLSSAIQTCAGYNASEISLSPLRLNKSSCLWKEWQSQQQTPCDNPRRRFPDEEKCQQLYTEGTSLLQTLGYRPVTPWHFQLSGSNHPLLVANYCADTDTLGLGLNAVSRYDGIRCRNTDDFALYLAHSGEFEKITVEAAVLAPEEQLRHGLIRGLFAVTGIDLTTFSARYPGTSLSFYENEFRTWEEKGWISRDSQKIALTASGYYHYPEICGTLSEKIL